MEKPPVHIIEELPNGLSITRVKPPVFTANYIDGQLVNVLFSEPEPINANAVLKKALAAIRYYYIQKETANDNRPSF